MLCVRFLHVDLLVHQGGQLHEPAGRERDGFVAVELDQADGNPAAIENPLINKHHSVLTHSLDDEPGTPTRDALDQVLELFRTRLEL